MRSSSQLPLPLPSRCSLSRADLVVAASNEHAVAFIDSWPDWPARAAALCGPPGSGKTHLISIWREMSGARTAAAAEIAGLAPQPGGLLAIEDVDSSEASLARDTALFAALESVGAGILLTGRTPPSSWPCVMPDLASRFSALTTLPIWTPDEALLAALARKLFADRQILVPDAVIEAMLRRLARTPAAIRDFVAELDAAALAGNRAVSTALVRDLIATREAGSP